MGRFHCSVSERTGRPLIPLALCCTAIQVASSNVRWIYVLQAEIMSSIFFSELKGGTATFTQWEATGSGFSSTCSNGLTLVPLNRNLYFPANSQGTV